MDLLASSLVVCPELLKARRFMRAAQVQLLKKKKANSATHVISSIVGLIPMCKALALMKSGKHAAAMVEAEKLMRIDAANLKFLEIYMSAAENASLPEAAVLTLESAREFHPANVQLLTWLGDLHKQMGQTSQARDCYEKVVELSPNDPAALKRLKDAMAVNAITNDGWNDSVNKGGSYRDMMKNSDEAKLLEQRGKAVKTDDDADNLIADTLAKIAAEPQNINYYRALARLYSQKRLFEKAVETLEKARELSPGDPELDNALSRTRADLYEKRIAECRAAGDEAAVQAMEAERAQFVFDDLQDRVQRYPNDLDLRFEFGKMLSQYEYVDEAIQQFQRAQRSPKLRIQAFYELAMCFKMKKQYDMAKEQLESAVQEHFSMDDTKKNILYELGALAEAMGDVKTAAGYYKQIYQVDIGFRDISQKIEQVYGTGG